MGKRTGTADRYVIAIGILLMMEIRKSLYTYLQVILRWKLTEGGDDLLIECIDYIWRL
ncbi:hypothetical protein [Psychrobacillus psychrodurans]|uniref:Uncharacterized protein n=1 Tax=Psychrobacillus psychrodurans TaxID=126157 RepID=A0A9X3LBA6_9BACI|nr:hypothetical protein [Psychrobacillus psychrodurans]MCZ8534862.1 hypothetical protein [Psychrobacillus psychrodurans]